MPSKLTSSIHRELANEMIITLTKDEELIMRNKGSKKPDVHLKLSEAYDKLSEQIETATNALNVIEDIQEWVMVADFQPSIKTKLFEYFKNLKDEYKRQH